MPNDFLDFGKASIVMEKAFSDFNECMPHSSIEHLPPREFRKKFLEDQSFREKYEKKLEAKLNEK